MKYSIMRETFGAGGKGEGRPRLSKRDNTGLLGTNGFQGVQKEPVETMG